MLSFPKIKEYGFIFIIPSVILLLAFYIDAAASPYWIKFDPSYVYLLNSLNLTKGLPPPDVSHPGTTIQMICAAVYWVFNIGQTAPTIITRVLTAPEFYLHVVHVLLITGLFTSSALVGGYLYHKTRNKIAVLLIQLPAIPLLVDTFGVSPDPFLIMTVNLFNLFFLQALFARSSHKKLMASLGLAMVCGLGVATKMIFLPLLLIPILILAWRLKLVFIIACPAAFILFTLPITSEYPRMFQWFSSLAQHTGVHGIGKSGIDWNQYVASWKSILINHVFLLLSAGAALIWASLRIIRKNASREIWFLAAASIGVLVQFAVVAKSYQEHYLLPGLVLIALVWPLFYLIRMSAHRLLKHIAIVFIIVSSLQSISFVLATGQQWTKEKNDILSFDHQIRAQFPGCVLIGSYPAYSLDFALLWANDNSHTVADELSQLYPDAVHFNNLSYGITNFKERIFTDDLLADGRSVIFMDSRSNYFEEAPYVRKLIAYRGNSSAYLLISSQEKAVEGLFNAANIFFTKGEYPQALAVALKARALNYQPRGKIDYFLQMILSKIPR